MIPVDAGRQARLDQKRSQKPLNAYSPDHGGSTPFILA